MGHSEYVHMYAVEFISLCMYEYWFCIDSVIVSRVVYVIMYVDIVS